MTEACVHLQENLRKDRATASAQQLALEMSLKSRRIPMETLS
jgi:hypothetical protein